MDLATAALIFSTKLMDTTYNPAWAPYDRQAMSAVVAGIVETTNDVQLVETLIKIARWESGGFRADVATCKIKGDGGAALGIFQVHPINAQERADLCSPDFAKQAAVALSHVNDSVNTCKRLGFKGSDLITVYTHGKCHVAKDGVPRLHWGDGKEIQAILDVANQSLADDSQ